MKRSKLIILLFILILILLPILYVYNSSQIVEKFSQDESNINANLKITTGPGGPGGTGGTGGTGGNGGPGGPGGGGSITNTFINNITNISGIQLYNIHGNNMCFGALDISKANLVAGPCIKPSSGNFVGWPKFNFIKVGSTTSNTYKLKIQDKTFDTTKGGRCISYNNSGTLQYSWCNSSNNNWKVVSNTSGINTTDNNRLYQLRTTSSTGSSANKCLHIGPDTTANKVNGLRKLALLNCNNNNTAVNLRITK